MSHSPEYVAAVVAAVVAAIRQCQPSPNTPPPATPPLTWAVEWSPELAEFNITTLRREPDTAAGYTFPWCYLEAADQYAAADCIQAVNDQLTTTPGNRLREVVADVCRQYGWTVFVASKIRQAAAPDTEHGTPQFNRDWTGGTSGAPPKFNRHLATTRRRSRTRISAKPHTTAKRAIQKEFLAATGKPDPQHAEHVPVETSHRPVPPPMPTVTGTVRRGETPDQLRERVGIATAADNVLAAVNAKLSADPPPPPAPPAPPTVDTVEWVGYSTETGQLEKPKITPVPVKSGPQFPWPALPERLPDNLSAILARHRLGKLTWEAAWLELAGEGVTETNIDEWLGSEQHWAARMLAAGVARMQAAAEWPE